MALSADAANDALDAGLDTALRAQLHVGAPGASGLNNPFGDTTQQVLTWSAAASGEKVTSATATWSSVSAAGTVTHVSLWTTGGGYRGSAQLSTPKVLAVGETLVLAAITFTGSHD